MPSSSTDSIRRWPWRAFGDVDDDLVRPSPRCSACSLVRGSVSSSAPRLPDHQVPGRVTRRQIVAGVAAQIEAGLGLRDQHAVDLGLVEEGTESLDARCVRTHPVSYLSGRGLAGPWGADSGASACDLAGGADLAVRTSWRSGLVPRVLGCGGLGCRSSQPCRAVPSAPSPSVVALAAVAASGRPSRVAGGGRRRGRRVLCRGDGSRGAVRRPSARPGQ